MKKLFLTFLLTGFAASAFAASAERNNIRMVTFFPVPYVTYNQLNVRDELLLGGKTSFTGTLGSMTKSETWSLVLTPKAGTVTDPANPPVTLNFNVLSLNVKSSSTNRTMGTSTVVAGTSSNKGAVTLNFGGTLTVNQLSMAGPKQITVSGTGKVKEMYVFPQIIKGCNATSGCTNAQINAGTASCSHTKWKTLQLKKEDNTYESKTFLVCE